MAKTKRGKRRSKRNRRRQSFDKPRTCVSSPEVSNKSQTIFNLVDLIAPILTPSPVYHDCDVVQQQTDISIPRFQSPVLIQQIKTPLKDDGDLLAISATPKRNKDDGVRCSILNYRTPIKRSSASLRTSRNLARSLTPQKQVSFLAAENDCDKHKSPKHDIYTIDKVRYYSPMISPIHNSTPKLAKTSSATLISPAQPQPDQIHEISPILTPNNGAGNCSIIQVETKRPKKLRKFGPRKLPMSLLHVYSWLQAALKKGYAALKRLICGEQQQQQHNNKTVPEETSLLFRKCLRENQLLNYKIKELQTELNCFKNELEQFDTFKMEFKLFKQQFTSFAAHPSGSRTTVPIPLHLPPPPPPPPPPFPLIIGPTPTSRPTKTMHRKDNNNKQQQQQNNENSRPLITVEELLKVRLKKANVSTFTRKNPISPSLKNNEILKQVKLRPTRKMIATRSRSPQTAQRLGTSPISTLERMLRDVDPNVRTVRRTKKTQFLSVNDVSRSPSFRYRHGNDSAPVM